MNKPGFVYIITNRQNRVLYIGVTSQLKRRIWEHRNRKFGGFTCRYNIQKLVYYEYFPEIEVAISREKKLKDMSRASKERLINEGNPEWRDLYSEI